MFRHECPLAVKPASTPRDLDKKKTWRDSLPIDMFLSAVSVLVVAQPSSEVPEGLTNYPVYVLRLIQPYNILLLFYYWLLVSASGAIIRPIFREKT
jgi:hypothetical protein